MQHVKNVIEWNAMKMLKMHQNANKCTRMRMGKINTTFGKKQQQSLTSLGSIASGSAIAPSWTSSSPTERLSDFDNAS